MVNQNRFNLEAIRVAGDFFVLAGLVIYKTTYLLPLAYPQVACCVEAGTVLDEGFENFEPQCFCQLTQFIQRSFKFEIGHAREMYGGNDSVPWVFFNFALHSVRRFLE